MNVVEEFLKELRESADIQYKIFTEGSCFRLYRILKTIFPEAKPYWSDRDGHCITKIDGKYYDIGGRVTDKYVKDEGYYRIIKDQIKAYSLMKWVDKETNLSITVQKYY